MNNILIGIAIVLGAIKVVQYFLTYKLIVYAKKHPDEAKEIRQHSKFDYRWGTETPDKECATIYPELYRLQKNLRRTVILFHSALYLLILLALLGLFFKR